MAPRGVRWRRRSALRWVPLLVVGAGAPWSPGAAEVAPELGIGQDGPGVFRDNYVHVGYQFALSRTNFRREGDGEMWMDFEYGLPRFRLRGRATSPRFGEGDINLVIDASEQVLYVMLKLRELHEVECLAYPFPTVQENRDRMKTILRRRDEVVRWQTAQAGQWGHSDVLPVAWTRSLSLDFLLAGDGKELVGVDLRHRSRVVKTVRLNDTAETAGTVPDGARLLFQPPRNCRPAAVVKEPVARVELIPPYSKSSTLNDLLLILADHAKNPCPRSFLVLSALMLPGDVAILIEDPAPPDLEGLSSVAFEYQAQVYALGTSLPFNEDRGPQEGANRTSAGSVWLNLKDREFRLEGGAKATKVGPLTMDLVALGVATKVYANVNLEVQKEQQCVAYDYPQPPDDTFKEVDAVLKQSLAFYALSETQGEDCGIFVAPLSGGRWIHLFVDLESDRPEAILRSEIHKNGRVIRAVDVLQWHVDQDVSRSVQPDENWHCAEVPGDDQMLAHLGLRKPHMWSMELQDALHALLKLEQHSAVLMTLALLGDVAIMVHEPAVPPLWQLPQASFLYSVRMGDLSQPQDPHQPFTAGTFAADYESSQLRLTASTAGPDGANISIAITEDIIAVRVDHPSLAESQCLMLPMEGSRGCSPETENSPCGRSSSGRCGKTNADNYVCKDAECHARCTALFGSCGDAVECVDSAEKTPEGRPCTSGVGECCSCRWACLATCTNVAPEQGPCLATLNGDDGTGAWSATFAEGSFDTNELAEKGAQPKAVTSLIVRGEDCVVTVFPEPGFGGHATSFQQGAYEADELASRAVTASAQSVFVQRQQLALVHRSSTDVRFVQRTLANGVRGWADRLYNYTQVPQELLGAVLFAGPYSVPTGNITLISPRDGVAFVWGEVGAVRTAYGNEWEKVGWNELGTMSYDAGDGELRPVKVYGRAVFAAVPLDIAVPGTWIGGVAFKASTTTVMTGFGDGWAAAGIPQPPTPPPSQPRQPGTAGLGERSNASAAIGIFDGVEDIDGRECNRFSMVGISGDSSTDWQSRSVELWYSKQDEVLCRMQVLPRPAEPARAGAVVEVPGWSAKYLPGPVSPSDTGLAEAPSGWHCKAAAGVDNPWLWLSAEPVAVSLPAALAVNKLAEATGAVGLLPPRALHALSRLVVTAPHETAETTSTSAAPPPKPVDLFGPELRSFSFSFTSVREPGGPGGENSPTGRGEVKVDLAQRRMYLRMEGTNLSAGIPRVDSHLVLRGERDRLYSRIVVLGGGPGGSPFEQCWSLSTRGVVPLPVAGTSPNPFMRARVDDPGPNRATMDVAPGKRVELVFDVAHALVSLAVYDSSRTWASHIAVEGWSTEPVDAGWFDTGTHYCPDLFFQEDVTSIGGADLLAVFFPNSAVLPGVPRDQ